MSIFDEVYDANMNSGYEQNPDNKALKPVSVRNNSHIHTHLKINLIRRMYNSPDMYHHGLSLRLLALSLFEKKEEKKNYWKLLSWPVTVMSHSLPEKTHQSRWAGMINWAWLQERMYGQDTTSQSVEVQSTESRSSRWKVAPCGRHTVHLMGGAHTSNKHYIIAAEEGQ